MTNSLVQPLVGHVEVWAEKDGTHQLVHEQPNMIMDGAAQILAKCLSGDTSFGVWGIRFGFFNTPTPPPGVQPVTGDNALPMTQYANPMGSQAFQLITGPSYTTYSPTPGRFQDNVVRFQATLVNGLGVYPAGAQLEDGTSNIFEVALITNPGVGISSQEKTFARTQFKNTSDVLTPVLFDGSYNFTVVWAIKVTV